MAFIKTKERKSLINKINQSYGFRKFLISIEILALIGFIVVVLLQGFGVIKLTYTNLNEGKEDFSKGLTPFGIGMVVYACIIAVLGVISLILTFTIKSPKKIRDEMNKLQSSALSGKRVKSTDSNIKINKSRTTITKTVTK